MGLVNETYCRIIFAGPDGKGEEALWAVPALNDTFRLVSTPLLAVGVAPGDLVRAKRVGSDDAFLYVDTLQFAPTRVFMIHPAEGALSWNSIALAALQRAVTAAASDTARLGLLIAASVPCTLADAFGDTLKRGERAGRWIFAETTARQDR